MVDEPSVIIDGCLERVREITWWNRYLTNLTNLKYFKNGLDFLRKGLLEQKGPLIEYIRQPASSVLPFVEFATKTNLDPALIESVNKNLFGKLPVGLGKLYVHQEESIRLFLSDRKSDFIITIPTSGGKTEAFLIPILNHCLSSKERGLKALLIYPMKTLATDQFNRLMKFVNDINKSSDSHLTVAIWDGDTPQGTTDPNFPKPDFQAYNEPHQRGLQCPRCRGDLLLTRDEILKCAECSFSAPWAKATRNAIRDAAGNIDILITNPEALENMLIASEGAVQTLLGDNFSTPPLKYVVFDEAHIWRGAMGAAISLLIRRLRKMYEKRPIQFALVSATIDQPHEFASALLDTQPENVRVIGFKAEPIRLKPIAPDFSTIPSTNFEDLVEAVHLAVLDSDEKAELLASYPQLKAALELAIRLRLLHEKNGHLLPSQLALQMTEVSGAKDKDSVTKGPATLTQKLLQTPSFVESWKEHLVEESAEVMALVKRLVDAVGRGALVYVPEGELIEFVEANLRKPSASARSILATCLNLGRTAGLLSDKYHMFVSPPYQVFFCKECSWLASQESCPKCGKQSSELLFCEQCHVPQVRVSETAEDASKTTMKKVKNEKEPPEDDSEEDKISEEVADEVEAVLSIPEKLLKKGRVEPLYDAPYCSHPRIREPSVWYPTFITYMLSYLCRAAGSKKVLVFSDSRRTANTIVTTFQTLDHTLVAEQLFIRELVMAKDHELALGDIRSQLIPRLRAYFYDYIHNAANSRELKEFLRTYETQVVFSRSYLNNMPHLFDGVLVIPKHVLELARDDIDLTVGFELFREFYQNYEIDFQKNTIQFKGKTPSKLVQTVHRQLTKVPEGVVRDKTLWWLGKLIERGLVATVPADILRDRIENSQIGSDAKEELKKYFDDERSILSRGLSAELPLEATALLRRSDDEKFDNMILKLVPSVAFCSRCVAVFPIQGERTSCPRCGVEIKRMNRVEGASLGSCAFDPASPWSVDHWARELLDIAVQYTDPGAEIPHVFPGVHTAEARKDVRGILEKGFKQDPPKVNVISATPTLELGVDIGSLDIVLQVGIPPTLTNYIQRCGRAGRVRGRPSFVWTILRNQNSIDAYHFDNLSEYMRELRPLHIPRPEELDMVVASQIVGETLTTAARRADPSLYSNIRRVPDHLVAAQAVCIAAKTIAQAICELATSTSEGGLGTYLPGRLDSIFKRPDIFDALFKDKESAINLQSAATHFFDGLEGLGPDSINYYRDTATWLSELGFFCSYRGTGQAVPILSFKPGTSEASSVLMVQDYHRAISENYPGKQNGPGANFPYEGVSFIVKRVQASALIDNVRLCDNDNCILRYQPYPSSTSKCPNCKQELRIKSVLRPDMVYAEPVRRHVETRAELSALPRLVGRPDWHELDRVFFTKIQMAYGRVECVVFTPAYLRAGRRRKGVRSKAPRIPSEVPIPAPRDVPTGSALKLLTQKQFPTEFGHVGYRLETLGFALRFQLSQMVNLLRRDAFAGIVSLQQACRLAASIAADAELEDIQALWSLEEDSVTVYVYDSKARGTGVAKRAFAELKGKDRRFVRALQRISNCSHCAAYCSKCLLVERTPPHYVDDGLLDRKLVQRLLR